MHPPFKTCMVALAALACLSGFGDAASRRDPHPGWLATRVATNPLLTTASEGIVSEHGYANVNGPSVVRVPTWIDRPLGRYYMYFAHHRGSFIRLAYADSPEGPWTVWGSGVLHLKDTPALDHIASPDVHVDEINRTIRMYYHSVDDTTTWKQTTYLATSSDGLRFASGSEPLGPPYLRAFAVDDSLHESPTWWGIAKVRGGPGGVLLRADRPEGPFKAGPRIIPGMRHASVLVDGAHANVFFSRIGDEPERLLVTRFDPAARWTEQTETEAFEVLRSELDFEGADLPITGSQVGEASEPVHALRDPFVFTEDGRHHLFYSIAGENGIAVARLIPTD